MNPATSTPTFEDAKRLLAGLAHLEPAGDGRWRALSRARKTAIADPVLVSRLERAGLLTRLPDGRLIPSAPAARRRLIQTTIRGENGEPRTVTINAAESPLGWMIHRKGAKGAPEFDTPLIAAAERLRQDYTLAHLEPRLTAALDGFVTSGAHGRAAPATVDPPVRALAAKQRFFAALDAVGPELSNILAEVCCLTAGLEQAERNLALPARSGKAVLRLALTRLARHYGFVPPERPIATHRAIRHWNRPLPL
jgi:hypothetical protein